ncbi:MAG: protease, partial [Proteobacteria bacterium]
MRALLAKLSLLSFLISLLASVPSLAAERGARFQNLDQMIEALNLRPYFSRDHRPERAVRVAIFDNGFKDADKEIGRSLPRNTQIIPGPVPLEGEEDVHGFYMARILWSLVSLGGEDERYAPAEFRLYRTFGYSNFEAAIKDAIARKVDVILYSQSWDYGGNFDGRGFINKLVNQALDAGILWINSSGNTGSTTYNGGIVDGRDGWIKLPGRNDSVEIRCPKTPLGKCPLRAVLSWNDFKDDVTQGSDKDLDFVLTDDTLNIVQSSALRQVKTAEEAAVPGSSQYPREIITAELKPGVYFLRVKKKSENFSSRDAFRISVQGDSLQMRNADRRESVLAPADNARVISVGASD